MKSAKLTIHNTGKISLEGVIFDSHGEYPLEAFLDTGCTDAFAIDQLLADAVCAPVVEEVTRTTPGGGIIRVFMRKINVRFGGLEIRELRVAVPEIPTGRNLMGISFLQAINAFIILDFNKGKTEGCFFTTDSVFSHRIGKQLHNITIHGNDLVGGGACVECDQTGR